MKIDLNRELSRLDAAQTRTGLRHRFLHEFEAAGGSYLGVAQLHQTASPDHWEVHDGGDELLFVVSGKILVELCRTDGRADWQIIAAGQCIVIERSATHAVTVLEDATILFMTPREGSRSWQAEPGRSAKDAQAQAAS